MATDSNAAFVNTDNAPFPNNKSVNASGPTATDGTEFVKTMIDNYMFGPQLALLNYAGLIPDGVPVCLSEITRTLECPEIRHYLSLQTKHDIPIVWFSICSYFSQSFSLLFYIWNLVLIVNQ